MLQLPSAAGFDGESEPAMDTRERHPSALHTSRSTPGLSQQFTRKISSSLLHNLTVIHRPKLDSRHTVLNSSFVSRLRFLLYKVLLTLRFSGTAPRVYTRGASAAKHNE
jgi:hypothetical protein